MKVDLITETNSDLTVVNAARCSFDKESSWLQCAHHLTNKNEPCPNCFDKPQLDSKDQKLIKYLANNNHWTPFGHPQERFQLALDQFSQLMFLKRANLSGFEIGRPDSSGLTLRGSIYAWLNNIHFLPEHYGKGITYLLNEKYPVSTRELITTGEFIDIAHYPELIHINNFELQDPELNTYTLRIHCPIFVKRQLETHRRNMVITDIEDFCQNEVSRRYVDTEPEFYLPSKWRVQHSSKKQGSDESQELEQMTDHLTTLNYTQHVRNALIYYNKMNSHNIAHEQSRMILPLSTYTTFWWTGSLKSWKRVFGLRLDSHAQNETRELVQMIKDVIDEDRKVL